MVVRSAMQPMAAHRAIRCCIFMQQGVSRPEHPVIHAASPTTAVRLLVVDRPGHGLSSFQPRRFEHPWNPPIVQAFQPGCALALRHRSLFGSSTRRVSYILVHHIVTKRWCQHLQFVRHRLITSMSSFTNSVGKGPKAEASRTHQRDQFPTRSRVHLVLLVRNLVLGIATSHYT
jgi:hypothetical protein